MTLGMSAMGLSSLAVHDESDAPPRRCRLSGGEIQTEVGDTPERVRTKAGGGDAQLHPRVVRPAALLLDRLAAAELPSQGQIEVGDRELQRGRKRDQLLGRDVLESALDFGKIGGREARRPGDFRQGALGRSEEHTSELQSRLHLVCRLLLEKKKKDSNRTDTCAK